MPIPTIPDKTKQPGEVTEPITQTPASAAAPGQRLPLAMKMLWAAMFCAIAMPSIHVFNAVAQSNQQLPPVCTLVLIGLGALSLHKQTQPEIKSKSWTGAVLLLAMSLVNALSTIFSLTSIYILSLIGIIACTVWALAGLKYARHFAPVIVFACFSLVSMPDELRLRLSYPLQTLSLHSMLAIVSHVIPITANQHIFSINGQPYDVAPTCSGLNQWIGFLYAFLIWQMFQRFNRKGWITVLLAIPIITLVSNTARLSITALLGYYFSKDIALNVHSNLDYALFPLGLAAVWAIGRRFYAQS